MYSNFVYLYGEKIYEKWYFILDNDAKRWLDAILFSYRVSVQDSTNYFLPPPFFLCMADILICP